MSTAPNTSSRPLALTGGCQCGHVRYALHAAPARASICHCRMCQKAFGNYFAPFATVEIADLTWTRSAPAVFHSSEIVERGFCRECGTPLSFRFLDRTTISISIGSLDEPDSVRPTMNIGTEGRAAWLGDLLCEGESRTEDRVPAERLAQLASLQHPDHD